MIFPDGSEGFQIDTGIQIQGGGSRTPAEPPKHGCGCCSRTSTATPSSIPEVFPDSDVDSFDALILKGPVQQHVDHWDPKRALRASTSTTSGPATAKDDGRPRRKARAIRQALPQRGVLGPVQPDRAAERRLGRRDPGGDKADYDVYDNEAVLISGNSTAWNTMFSLANARAVKRRGDTNRSSSTSTSRRSSTTWC